MRDEKSSNSAVWTTPKEDDNEFLFMESVSQLSTALAVSIEEMEDWQRRGWISFHPRMTVPVSSPLCSEVEFIRNLARSGLPLSQIDEMLRFLKRPYRYNPELVVFHPRYGWVSPKTEGKALDESAKSKLSSNNTDRLVRRLKFLDEQLRLLMDDIVSLQ